MAQVIAQRVGASMPATDEKLRSDPEAARRLLLTLRSVGPELAIPGRPVPLSDWATDHRPFGGAPGRRR